MPDGSFEILESPDEGARFCIAYSDAQTTVGVIILKADGELPRHHWPASAHLLQLNGQCAVTLFNADSALSNQHELGPGNDLLVRNSVWHILTNTGDEESITLFKVLGDASSIVDTIRSEYTHIGLEAA